MSSMLERWRNAAPIRRLLIYRAHRAVVAYLHLVGVCLLAGGAVVGSIWTWAQIFAMIAPWPF